MIGKLQKKLPIVTEDPVELSSRVIDAGVHDEQVNRVTQTLSVLDDDLSIVELRLRMKSRSSLKTVTR